MKLVSLDQSNRRQKTLRLRTYLSEAQSYLFCAIFLDSRRAGNSDPGLNDYSYILRTDNLICCRNLSHIIVAHIQNNECTRFADCNIICNSKRQEAVQMALYPNDTVQVSYEILCNFSEGEEASMC